MPSSPPKLLIIAGSDPSGGAGIQADIKTACAFDVFATTAITAVTVQNTQGVTDIHPVPPHIIAAQIHTVLTDIGADAIKIGMLHSAEVIHAVAAELHQHPHIPVVLDPVMVATSDDYLLETDAMTALASALFPLSTLITPNLPEANALLGKDNVGGPCAAKALAQHYALQNVLVKGGHGAEDTLVDTLVCDGTTHTYSAAKQHTQHTHGTGCTLASAIACGLASGNSLPNSVKQAHAYVQAAIANAPKFGHGNGPLWHGVESACKATEN